LPEAFLCGYYSVGGNNVTSVSLGNNDSKTLPADLEIRKDLTNFIMTSQTRVLYSELKATNCSFSDISHEVFLGIINGIPKKWITIQSVGRDVMVRQTNLGKQEFHSAHNLSPSDLKKPKARIKKTMTQVGLSSYLLGIRDSIFAHYTCLNSNWGKADRTRYLTGFGSKIKVFERITNMDLTKQVLLYIMESKEMLSLEELRKASPSLKNLTAESLQSMLEQFPLGWVDTHIQGSIFNISPTKLGETEYTKIIASCESIPMRTIVQPVVVEAQVVSDLEKQLEALEITEKPIRANSLTRATVLALFEKNTRLKAGQVVDLLNVNKKLVYRVLYKLTQLGRLDSEGQKGDMTYFLAQKSNVSNGSAPSPKKKTTKAITTKPINIAAKTKESKVKPNNMSSATKQLPATCSLPPTQDVLLLASLPKDHLLNFEELVLGSGLNREAVEHYVEIFLQIGFWRQTQSEVGKTTIVRYEKVL
jgi:hypothetical protein